MLRNNEKQRIVEEGILAITHTRLPVSGFYCYITNLPKMYLLNNHHHLLTHDSVMWVGCGEMLLSVPGG